MLALMVGFVSVFICFCRIGRLEPQSVCEHPARGADLANGPLRTFDPALLCGYFFFFFLELALFFFFSKG